MLVQGYDASFPVLQPLWGYLPDFLSPQVLQSGATECPTKPKGRPRKSSYLSNKPKDPAESTPAPTKDIAEPTTDLMKVSRDTEQALSLEDDESVINVTDDDTQ